MTGLMQPEWSALRNSSIRDLKFPYDKYRKNQRKFAVAVYKTITASKRIFIQAPQEREKQFGTFSHC